MQKSREELLGSEAIGPLLARMAVPAVIAMGVNALYNLVDTIFIGRGVGPLAIGGVSIAFPIQIIVLAVGLLVGIGSASIVSRAMGAGDRERAEKTVGNALFLTLSAGLVVTIVGLSFADEILRLFGATEELLPYARQYLTTILPGAVFVSTAVAANHITRSQGHSRIAMTIMLIGAGMNIVLDPIFIFGFGMGVRGAALATVIAQSGSFFFALWFYITGRASVSPRLRHLRPTWDLIPETLALGMSPFVRQIGASLFVIFTNNALRMYGSDLSISAFGIIHKVLIFSLLPLVGIAQGFQPIAGFNFGARNFDRVRLALRKTLLVTSFFGGILFLAIQLFPGLVFSIFTDDAELIAIGRNALRIVLMVLPILTLQITGSIFFQAIGKALPALVLTLSRQMLFLIPLVLILPTMFGTLGVWIAFPAADILSIGITGAWLATEVRHLRRMECRERPSQEGCEDVDELLREQAAAPGPVV
jgi:putative MATE family efflux protein